MPSSSVITDQRYYVIDRVEDVVGPGLDKACFEDCDEMLAKAPSGRLDKTWQCPHIHRDREEHYVEERRRLGDRKLPVNEIRDKMRAYPANPDFDYDNQIRKPRGYQKCAANDDGYKRIVTDLDKNRLGFSYHPHQDRSNSVRSPVQGAFIADYKQGSEPKMTPEERQVAVRLAMERRVIEEPGEMYFTEEPEEIIYADELASWS